MCNAFVWFAAEAEEFQGAQFDICHGHDWLAAKAVVQCKHMGRNTVATVHSTEFGRCGNANFGGQSERIRGIEGEVIGVADRVIAVSGVLCDEVKREFQFDHNKLRMVHNGIHLGPYDGGIDAGVVKGRLGIGAMEPLVVFVGRLVTQKGPDLLLEAVPRILAQRGDAKFAICGDGYMRGDLERRAHELGVAHAVRFLGSVSGAPLVELFKSADCVCVPSRNEPFGIVVLEAWASGKPVVATTSGGPREFVQHGEDGFHVDPHPESIAWGVCEVFANFDRARDMGGRGRHKAGENFNWDRIAEQTERIYRELCP
jgi:glycosyltransferase involved in cell wall biosynthesis